MMKVMIVVVGCIGRGEKSEEKVKVFLEIESMKKKRERNRENDLKTKRENHD